MLFAAHGPSIVNITQSKVDDKLKKLRTRLADFEQRTEARIRNLERVGDIMKQKEEFDR